MRTYILQLAGKSVFLAMVVFSLSLGGKTQAVYGAEAGLRASAGRVDLTPSEPRHLGGYQPRVSEGVNDPIHHRVLILEHAGTEWVLVSSEFCVISPETYDRAASRLEAELDIPRLNFWWTLTHTHSAPEVGPPGFAKVYLGERYEHRVDHEYHQSVEDELVRLIAETRKTLRPAEIVIGWGHSKANMNRRSRNPDGSVSLGMNPYGPVDQKIGLIKVEDEAGELIGLVANYPIHGTVLGGKNLLISGDAPGVVSTYLEAALGAPVLFINGAAGDIAPLYSVYDTPREGRLDQFQVLLGDRILKALAGMDQKVSAESLVLGETSVSLPKKNGLIIPESLVKHAGPDGSIKLPVRFLKLGRKLGIWAAPVELFCEISNEVRETSPFPNTFYFGYANGWFGYLLTDDEYLLGGYESRVTPFGLGAENILKQEVHRTLKGLFYDSEKP